MTQQSSSAYGAHIRSQTPVNAKIVLIVDDEAHVLSVMGLKLRAAGLEVITALDGQEALELATASRPDVLISDYNMPKLNGLELCRALEANPATAAIPTLLVTSREHDVGEKEIAGTSIRMVLGKPFSPNRLVAAVKELL
jgi:two-component system chemotaxis response regulator CheY